MEEQEEHKNKEYFDIYEKIPDNATSFGTKLANTLWTFWYLMTLANGLFFVQLIN